MQSFSKQKITYFVSPLCLAATAVVFLLGFVVTKHDESPDGLPETGIGFVVCLNPRSSLNKRTTEEPLGALRVYVASPRVTAVRFME